jgi:hypothetical protein
MLILGVMTTKKASPPAPAQTEDGDKPAGHTGEGSGSIVAALAHHQRWVDQLVNRAGLPDVEPDPDVEAS